MIEYKDYRMSDFWERFRNATTHSIPLPIKDVNLFAASILMELIGCDSSAKHELSRHKFWTELYGATMNGDALRRYVNAMELINAYKVEDAYKIRRMEHAFTKNECPNQDVDVRLMAADVKEIVDSNSLWFDQKVYICFRVIYKIFFPNRYRFEEKTSWNREHTWQYKKTETVYDRGWRHEYRMNEKEWITEGKDVVSNAVADAYLREIEQLSACFDRIDFGALKMLLGSEFDAVVAVTKSVLLADEISRMNATLSSIDSRIQSSLAKEKVLYANLRNPVRDVFRTSDEEINVIVWETGLWRRHKVDMAVGSFLMKILR